MNKLNNAPAFLTDGGTLGARMRAHDWSASPLGHPTTWPQSLRTVVSLLLNSKFPMFVAWGPELGFLYNDAYSEILGAKHPAALGKRFYDIWSEVWSDISPLVDRALRGEATYSDRLALTMQRHGYEEQTWFTYSYSPVRDEQGKVAGIYCACIEITGQVLAEEYRNQENERFRTLFAQAPGFRAILRGPNHVFDLTNEAHSQLVGHRHILGKPAREALPEVVGQGFITLLDQVYATGEAYVGYATPITLQHEPNGTLAQRFVGFVYQPIRDARGVVTGIFAEGSDVTERKAPRK
ncbi:MAG TPA: PAS domain-containing protein, partial [Noviherbaspirillum sp.]